MPFAVPFVARPVPVVLLPAASHQSQACGPERCPPGVGALGCHRGTSPCLLRLPASVRARACVCEVERRGRRERACTHTHTQTQTQTHTHTHTQQSSAGDAETHLAIGKLALIFHAILGSKHSIAVVLAIGKLALVFRLKSASARGGGVSGGSNEKM